MSEMLAGRRGILIIMNFARRIDLMIMTLKCPPIINHPDKIFGDDCNRILLGGGVFSVIKGQVKRK